MAAAAPDASPDLEFTGFWEKLQPASYEADGEQVIKFAILSQEQTSGIRVVKRPRPYRPGVKLDETGATEKEWTLEAPFFNGVKEPDLGDAPQMWPDRLDLLEAIVDKGRTATLNLPWRRGIRCKITKVLRRASTSGGRDGEMATLFVCEDNEDRVDDQALASVSVSATVLNTVAQASFDMENAGMWDGSLEDFTELAADVEGALAAPGELLDDLAHKARRLGRAAKSIRQSFSSRVEGRDQMNDPNGSRAELRLLELEDMAAKAQAEAESQLPATVTRVFDTDRDIYQIAVELGQSARELIGINGDLEDVGFIPAGTPVRVFAK